MPLGSGAMIAAELEVLTEEECLAALRASSVGRVGFLVDGAPMVLPVNFRVVDGRGRPVLLIRTRPGTELDRAPRPVALEVGGDDPVHRVGWSVVVRGALVHVAAPSEARRADVDPMPWLEVERDRWLALEPVAVTGRRLVRPEEGWAFHVRGYL
jgi:nitroimidazol reductase NimA-like FMN-containing flavoprotein (pyridoxamine 5'-phosphate oxidase superfamily)